jgi:hypothetical protein
MVLIPSAYLRATLPAPTIGNLPGHPTGVGAADQHGALLRLPLLHALAERGQDPRAIAYGYAAWWKRSIYVSMGAHVLGNVSVMLMLFPVFFGAGPG